MNKAYNKRKLYTNPIEPDTSTDENPINAHLTKLLDINGFLAIFTKLWSQFDNSKYNNNWDIKYFDNLFNVAELMMLSGL